MLFFITTPVGNLEWQYCLILERCCRDYWEETQGPSTLVFSAMEVRNLDKSLLQHHHPENLLLAMQRIEFGAFSMPYVFCSVTELLFFWMFYTRI